MSYYVSIENADKRSSYFYMDLSSGYYDCSSPDKFVSNDLSNSTVWAEGLIECFAELDRTKSFNAERIIRNRSPLTGVIYE